MFRSKEMDSIFILSKIAFMILDSPDDACTKALAIFVGWYEERTSHKIVGINNGHWRNNIILLPMIRRVNRSRGMARVNNWSKNRRIIERFHAKILTSRIKCRADVGTIHDLASIVGKNLKGHGMTNMLSDADPATRFLTGIRRKIGIVHLVVDGFIPTEEQQWTNVIHRTSKYLKRSVAIQGGRRNVVQKETDVQ
jgi:hypothetical protein